MTLRLQADYYLGFLSLKGGCPGSSESTMFFSASKNRKSLNHLKTVIEGPGGVKGAKREMDGKNAEHLYIQVGAG